MNSRTSNVYYERILELLSGCWTPLNGQGDDIDDEVSSWMQELGVIIWYFAKPSTTLNECIELYDEKFKKIKI